MVSASRRLSALENQFGFQISPGRVSVVSPSLPFWISNQGKVQLISPRPPPRALDKKEEKWLNDRLVHSTQRWELNTDRGKPGADVSILPVSRGCISNVALLNNKPGKSNPEALNKEDEVCSSMNI